MRRFELPPLDHWTFKAALHSRHNPDGIVKLRRQTTTGRTPEPALHHNILWLRRST